MSRCDHPDNLHCQTALQPVSYEELPWSRDPESLALVPKSRCRAIGPTYRASIPSPIVNVKLELVPDLLDRLAELLTELVRFDTLQQARGCDLPALLLRGESAASSQIENLTSSVRNVALAEVCSDAPHNARLIAGNVAAMRTALSIWWADRGDYSCGSQVPHRPDGSELWGRVQDRIGLGGRHGLQSSWGAVCASSCRACLRVRRRPRDLCAAGRH